MYRVYITRTRHTLTAAGAHVLVWCGWNAMGRTDRRTDIQTPDRCSTITTIDSASVKSVLLFLLLAGEVNIKTADHTQCSK